MPEPVILAAVRTPFGKKGGVFRETRADRLLAYALQGLVERSGVDVEQIGDVITGNITQADEQAENIGRFGALLAGLPLEVPAVTLNRMCGSSQQAVHFAAQAIAAGDMDYAIGAGVEQMSRVPMFAASGGKFTGPFHPEVHERYELIHQGESAERIAARWGISRAELDDFSAESHRRASQAMRDGLNREILPTPGLNGAGESISVSRDEGVRELVDREKMASLRPAFRPDGVVTAANSSQIADGAAAVLVGNREAAEAAGLRPRARFRARVAVGSDPTLQLTGVIPATHMALKKAGLTLDDIDWIEINEAFASVVLAWAREFQPDMAKVNPWGGAIAHGHPLGASGAALMAKMLVGLETTGGQFGLQTMCIGNGMGTATIIERVDSER
ncbi:MAG: thiolase family protein [Chloroflexaceae bacterium]|nr:thiolase family protein [Chloroflexaceae bacterium]